ncbi:SPFH domain-containing protein [Marinicella litoralis]|uniref:Regulator of protease activity HflC (Stomatin/prohibitin superfamily) n=1 Tax=Marinicella litoralis TaxID=644220 RepID=A0A4R6XR44_9GAMM|nr:SPFH domain-containing protein [Marinicella litoralis]TDR20347.1 regulator of protease activity HflC (stomatin/prohibitin superfamily) [Marinicella litoralis]
MVTEKRINAKSGIPMLLLFLLLLALDIVLLIYAGKSRIIPLIIFAVLMLPTILVMMAGLFMVNPNESKVLQLFGKYVGTVNDSGLRWANPFYGKKAVSLRVRNFESGQLKVNDSAGNPIEIATVVVWKVVDTAEAIFEVDDYESFVHIQTEAALRNLATAHPYESHNDEKITLRSDPQGIANLLQKEVQDRLDKAGVEVIEARISHLAYAQEIAASMLKRQQAQAIVAARTQIVAGAVGMVELALNQLSEKNIIELDDERKAAMVSNLLVVLCGEENVQPVVNSGSLY